MNNPPLIPQAFATSGNKNVIQDARQTGQDEEDATWSTGFPNITMQPSESGGLPPKGMDFNGIFNAISAPIVYLQKGGAYKFDLDYATKIGGYSVGSVLQSNDGLSSYVSLIDNNTTDFNSNPESIGASWASWAGDAVSSEFANEMAGKVDKVINGKNIAYVIDAYNDGTNWYRKWSDGWVEQGGYKLETVDGLKTLSLLLPFANTNYQVLVSISAGAYYYMGASPYSTSQMSYEGIGHVVGGKVSPYDFLWCAYGQGA